MRYYVIGITDSPTPYFLPEVQALIRQGKVFSGGKRHHDIVGPQLPADAQWIDITVPLSHVFEQYSAHFATHNSQPIIVFASGDPLFFGFANTLQRRFPEAEITVYPTFNSLQMLAHRLVMPYHDMRIVSLTGRPWPEFDSALIEGASKIGVLTDREHTPAAIAQRMIDYGYNDYQMNVGEHLGNPELETVTTLTLEEAVNREFKHPNCLILARINTVFDNNANHKVSVLDRGCVNPCLKHNHQHLTRPFGIPDSDFTILDGREKMITKMPIRLLTLQALELRQKTVFWDIGFCTGSVSIEARLQFPHLQICAFEIRPECEAIIQENARRFGTPGIDIHIGDFLETDLSALTRPDAVFIGGHGGHLKEIMAKVLTVITEDGVIVFNSVTSPMVHTDSHQLWDEACKEFHLKQEAPLRIQLNDYNPIEILKCRK